MEEDFTTEAKRPKLAAKVFVEARRREIEEERKQIERTKMRSIRSMMGRTTLRTEISRSKLVQVLG
jgi:hypothetical protein